MIKLVAAAVSGATSALLDADLERMGDLAPHIAKIARLRFPDTAVLEDARDVTLLGRYYERYADHAVAVARRMIFIVTGERPVPV